MKFGYSFSSALLIAGITFMGCSSGETITPNQAGEVEILEYCAGDEYKSDKDHFRATATGESMSRETAKKMARSNAEARLARSINSTIEIVTDNYVNSSKFNNAEEVTETFNDLARTVVDQQLSGAITACERLTQKSDGNYVSYMAIELSGDELVSRYNERLSQDERIRGNPRLPRELPLCRKANLSQAGPANSGSGRLGDLSS